MRKNHISAKIKKILAIACAAAMVATSMPANSAFATENDPSSEVTQGAEQNGEQNTNGTENSGNEDSQQQTTNEESGEGTSGDNTDSQQQTTNEESGEGKSGDNTDSQQQTTNEESGEGTSGDNTDSQQQITNEESGEGKSGDNTDSRQQTTNEESSEGKSGENTDTEQGVEPSGEGPEETVEKKIEIDFGIDEDASEKTDGEYTKLVFKASAEDSSTLETEIKKVTYELIDSEGTTAKSGEIKNKNIVINAEDLSGKNEEFTLKITATDADDETTSDEKKIKFYYQDPTVNIQILDTSKTLNNDSSKYTELRFSATAEVDKETSLDNFSYELKQGGNGVSGTFASGGSVEIIAQDLAAKGDYTLTVTAKDKNGVSSEEATKTVYMAKDDEGPQIEYEARTTSGNVLLDVLNIAQDKIIYKVTVTDVNAISLVQYQVINSTGDPDEVKELNIPDDSDSVEFEIPAPKKGQIKIHAEDEFSNGRDVTTNVLVVEDVKPAITLTQKYSGDIRTYHVFDVTVDDAPENEYSGLQSVTWKLTDGQGTDVKSADLYTPSEPESLDDLEKSYSKSGVIVSGSDLNGKYTITVEAKDWSGNTAEDSFEAIFDNTEPEVEFELNDAFKKEPQNTYKGLANNDGVITVKLSDPIGAGETAQHKYTYTIACDSTKLYTDAEATGDQDVELKLSDLNLEDGDHYIRVDVKDEAGKTTSKYQFFVVDNTRPVVSISVSANGIEMSEEDPAFVLYNKDGMEALSKKATVKFTVTDAYPVKEGWKLSYKVNGSPTSQDVTLDDQYTYSLELKDDGTYSGFKLEGKDLPGNESEYSSGNITEIGTGTELGMTAENAVIKISANDPVITIEMADDNKDSAYHNDGGFKVHIESNDDITGSLINDFIVKAVSTEKGEELEKNFTTEGAEAAESIDVTFNHDEIAGICKGEDTVTVTVTAETNYQNKSGVFTAAAGNNNAIKREDSEDGTTGTYYFDIVVPVITITYDSAETAYIYADKQDGCESEYSAYYKGNVDVSFVMDDTNDSDIYIDGKASGSATSKSCDEGVNVFTVYGTDLAGNPATVKEAWAGDVIDTTDADVITLVGKGSEDHGDEDSKYTVQVATVIDKEGPEVSFTATSRDYENSLEKTDDAILRYYNSAFSGTFTVEDTYPIDTGLITAELKENTDSEFNNQVTAETSIASDSSEPMSLSGEGTEVSYEATVTKAEDGANDGVYRFYIAGTDKAGNRLTISSANKSADEFKLFQFEEDTEDEYLISQPKVLDTVAPVAELFVKAGGKTIYDLDLETLNNAVKTYAPFQKVVKSTIEYTSEDKSPVMFSLKVKTTDTGKKEEERTTSLSSDFGNNINTFTIETEDEEGNKIVETPESYEIEAKKQIITLTGLTIKDRAGNKVYLTESNELIFDNEAPGEDTVAPKATIRATGSVTHRKSDGRDLFNYAPEIKVTVTDPGQKEYSSGLKNVTYDVYVDGQNVDSDEVSYTDYVEPAEALVDDEVTNNSLTYEKVFKIQLSESYQTNNIVIKVNAVDNSGNKMKEASYYCGIDTVGPEITVSYDNNSAQNSKYFKANRTAKITVIDRNINNGKIRINTQVSVPGSFEWSSGGGNGANDKWIKRLNYNTDGDYTLKLGKCTDALGNTATVKYTGVAPNEFIIDKTLPTIKVEFDNNSVQNAKYYKDPRTATVTVTDHNFSAKDTKIDTQVTPGGFSDSSRDIHIAHVTYSQDGVYTMYVTSTDLAGNTCATPVRIDEFVIDRTVPVITVTFNNNDAQNGKYYKDPRTATISIHEHNFQASDVKVTQTADIQQGSVSAPGVSGFGGGGDDHAASIDYSKDGNYTIEVNYTDLAGNPAQVVRVDEFVIDQTPPTLKFVQPDESKGTTQIFAGDIAPQIEFGDINMTRGMASITLSGMKGNSDILNLIEDSFENYKGTVRYENLKKVRESDDIYTATAVVTDLAGNKVEKQIVFSVNRFGSTYDYNGDDYTTNLVAKYYTNEAHDVVLREINVNQLTEHKLTLYKDGENRTLTEGKDYSFEEKQVNGHYEYIYTIFAGNFIDNDGNAIEGNYVIIATSKDKANNTNSNSTVKGNDGSNEVPLRFAIDTTAPINVITGVDMSKDKFTEEQITLVIEPQDNMNALAVFLVRVIDSDGKVLQEFTLDGEDLAKYLEEHDGVYTLIVDQNNKWQTIEVLTTDAAGNQSTDYSIEKDNGKDVLVTTNLFYQYINRWPLLLLTAAGIGALIFFIVWKRKKDEEEKEQA